MSRIIAIPKQPACASKKGSHGKPGTRKRGSISLDFVISLTNDEAVLALVNYCIRMF